MSSPDHYLCERIRQNDGSAVPALVARDHPVADLLFRVVSAQDADVAVLTRLWSALITDIKAGFVTQDLRLTLLKRIIMTLDEHDAFDPEDPPQRPEREAFLPEGHRWAGWWGDEPVPWPGDAMPTPEQIRSALRQVALDLRLVLVLRDIARMPAVEVLSILGLSIDQQEISLESAREAYVAHLDRELGG